MIFVGLKKKIVQVKCNEIIGERACSFNFEYGAVK